MRFLFFSAQYLPTAGGVERFSAELAHALRAQNHQVTIVTSALPGLAEQERDEYGVHILRLPAYLLMNGRFPVVRKNRNFARLAATLWQGDYDFALINTRFYPLCLWGAAQCQKRGVPAVVLEHGTKHLSLDNPLLNWFGNVYEHAMMRAVRRHCNRIYGISKASADWLRHFHVTAAGTLYNAVDAEAIGQIVKAPPCDIRTRYGLPKDAPVISFVGRFIVEKGVRELLDAFALLRQRLPEAYLVMAGDGPLWGEIHASPPEHVLLTGSLPHEETVALMAQSSLFCLPTYSEGFSSTILEAAAAGCCIVTTPTGGSPELIQSEKSGILVKDISPAALADVLFRVLRDDAFRQQAGEQVRQTAATRFTWQATAQGLLDIATSTINNDGTTP